MNDWPWWVPGVYGMLTYWLGLSIGLYSGWRKWKRGKP